MLPDRVHFETVRVYFSGTFSKSITLTSVIKWNWVVLCNILNHYLSPGGGRVVRWCWVTFQCRGVLQSGLQ